MTFYELLKRVYWALDEWIASSLGLGEYYGADVDEDEVVEDATHEVEIEDDDDDEDEDEDNDVADEDDGYDDMYKYHDHQA